MILEIYRKLKNQTITHLQRPKKLIDLSRAGRDYLIYTIRMITLQISLLIIQELSHRGRKLYL
jgi:hypothetical protein